MVFMILFATVFSLRAFNPAFCFAIISSVACTLQFTVTIIYSTLQGTVTVTVTETLRFRALFAPLSTLADTTLFSWVCSLYNVGYLSLCAVQATGSLLFAASLTAPGCLL